MSEVGRITAADAASIPTGADLNWRTVWPGQWTCDNAGYIWADSLKGGRTHMIDVRGWGYLTGSGIGALDLEAADAERIQDELGALLCAAPDYDAAARKMVAALGYAPDEVIEGAFGEDVLEALNALRAAIGKATTANSVGADGPQSGPGVDQ